MFGVPLDGPAQVFSDSESVVKNSSNPESRINKKHLSCAYHKVRENIAAGTIIVFFESGATNIADILTKSLPPEKRKLLMNGIFEWWFIGIDFYIWFDIVVNDDRIKED